MAVAVRVIPCLDVDAGRVVKGVNFQNLRDAGDPVEMAAVYDAEGADELTFLDVTASSGGRETMVDVVRRTAEQVFIPLTVGGGHPHSRRRRPDAARGRGQGVGQHRRDRPAGAAGEMARRFGSQCIVLSSTRGRCPRARADAVRLGGHHARRPARHRHRRRRLGRARRGAGRGGDPAHSMDADGTRAGFDLKMIAAVRAAVDVPVIASGGAGAVEHFAPAVRAGADAVLAASVFHFGTLRIGQVKDALRAEDVEVR